MDLRPGLCSTGCRGPALAFSAAQFEAFKKVHGEYFKPPYPAWTAIGNAVLLSPGAVVEMRLVAVIG